MSPLKVRVIPQQGGKEIGQRVKGADFFLNKVTYAACRSPAKKRAGNGHADSGAFKKFRASRRS